jgi:RimJ/RimL family protein N-acetyltransferase
VTTDWPAPPTLTGTLLTLRPFTGDDTEAMAEILGDPELLRLTGSVHTTAETQTDVLPMDTLREWYSTRAAQRDRLDLAVVDHDGGRVVGEVVLNERDLANAACNFRTLIGPAGRGRGLGTEAARLIVDYGLRVLGLHRIGLEVYAFNPRARRVYDKVGFVHEGTLRHALRFDDHWIDAHVMAVLADGPSAAGGPTG